MGGRVDPSGKLEDGREFSGIGELREHLLANQWQLARNLAKQLAIYSTGKGHRFFDRECIDSIAGRTETSGYGTRDILTQVILSPLFREEAQ